MGHTYQAIETYMDCLARAPDNAQARAELAGTFLRCGHLGEAIDHFRAAAKAAPQDAGVLAGLAAALLESGERQEPEDLFLRVLTLDPKHHEARSSLAGLYLQRGDFTGAAEECRRALVFRPDCDYTRWHYTQALLHQGRWNEAAAELERYLPANPDSADARYLFGLARLFAGDMLRGWDGLEGRFNRISAPARQRSAPEWGGEGLDGKTILLWAEHDLSDAIQFSRYIPLVAGRGGQVIVECRPELHALFRRMPGVNAVISPDEQPRFDYQGALLSLPRIFRTELHTIPPSCPPSVPEDMRLEWRERLGSFPGLRLGICWAAGSSEFAGPKSAVPFPILARLAALDGLYLFSLQPGGAAAELSSLPEDLRIYPLAGDNSTVLDMAAAILELDLIITADNVLAHLAGTLGAPVWTLLPHAADWRWMQDRTASPWYPTMRLLRQSTPGDWEPVVDRIGLALHCPQVLES